MSQPSTGGPEPSLLSISAVERDTGISKDTLRVWERRYGYPKPGRDAYGERTYSSEQVSKLRLLRRLLDQGHRPGRIINLPFEQLSELAGRQSAGRDSDTAEAESHELDRFIELVRAHRVDELRRELSQLVLRLGIERFAGEVASPLNRLVGETWSRGGLEVFEEHLYTESMQVILRSAISAIPSTNDSPQVLMTTFPNEPHGLGLLLAEALLSMEGCRCYSLGCETPVGDILRASQVRPYDIIALSFTACLTPNQIQEGLRELRGGLPAGTRIWAGGHCPSLQRRCPDGIELVSSPDQIKSMVAQWRTQHETQSDQRRVG